MKKLTLLFPSLVAYCGPNWLISPALWCYYSKSCFTTLLLTELLLQGNSSDMVKITLLLQEVFVPTFVLPILAVCPCLVCQLTLNTHIVNIYEDSV